MGAGIGPGLVSFWKHESDTHRDHFLGSGFFVGAGLILTAKHVLKGRSYKNVWVRPNQTATIQPFPLTEKPKRHRTLDAALARIGHMPPQARALVLDTTPSHEPQSTYHLCGCFEGDFETPLSVTVTKFDPDENQYVIAPKHPKGHSGSALCINSRAWGMATQQYAEGGTDRGCIISIHQIWKGWLEHHLEPQGTSQPVEGVGSFSDAPPTPRFRHLRAVFDTGDSAQPKPRGWDDFIKAFCREFKRPMAPNAAVGCEQIEAILSGEIGGKDALIKLAGALEGLEVQAHIAFEKPTFDLVNAITSIGVSDVLSAKHSKTLAQPASGPLCLPSDKVDVLTAVAAGHALQTPLLMRLNPRYRPGQADDDEPEFHADNLVSATDAVQFGHLPADEQLFGAMFNKVNPARRVLQAQPARRAVDHELLKGLVTRYSEKHGTRLIVSQGAQQADIAAQLHQRLMDEYQIPSFALKKDASSSQEEWNALIGSLQDTLQVVIWPLLSTLHARSIANPNLSAPAP